ncbi:TESTIS-SPECIFIC PROTEIN PBS13 T-COMPLEX 11 [Salix purpurea]|uniref:TESTIS-SPECIFIC PROTEIN PBS13 T-COMPLEX 11 n=1 Tax=Salix purpurea TaxID=77065 RepID=A0A9Q0TGU8_SALPP|nr:TESTIS-SPECIFIC PROTEIN PBS13 T-COMPLEX 11 [Salix purpurea]
MASKGPRSKLDHETRARRQKALEAPREPRRPKTQWDHVLEEMVWLSKDFESERKWKLAQAKKVALRASKGMLDQATRGEKKLKEEEQRMRKVALNISKDVKKFWVKIEKLALKQEISKVRIRMMGPLLTGPAGLDYLRKAFANHYGSDLDACISLPLIMQWLSSVKNSEDQEWEEHQNSLFSLKSHDSSSQVSVPFTTLRTGGSFLFKTNGSAMGSTSVASETDNQQPEPECTGERIDLLVRLGLLKIVNGVSGLTKETLPETFMLNLSRLRAVQAEIQKMIVISTSILVYRQSLLMERAVNSIAEMESILSERCNKLSRVLDRVDDVGIEEIVQVVGGFSQDDNEKHNPRKLVMARMLAKSLQAGDPVFEKVSRADYLALRGIVLGDSGPCGRKLSEMSLRPIGAVMLAERVVAAAEVLVLAAAVSTGVHLPWYITLTDNM